MIEEELNNLIEQLNSVLYSRYGWVAQGIGLILTATLGLIWFRLYFITQRVPQSKIAKWREALGYEKPENLSLVDAKWSSVLEKMESEDETSWKMAIMEADSLMDRLIQEMGYTGETMGERMQKITPKQFPMLDDAWRVHKVRNFIAHDPSYKLTEESAKKTISIYEDIFRELNVLDND
ncbi:MAG: hypothetical protein R3346_01760 [Candidatus Spechtbacterales bacterium]|nr:hypothetical protein [Candidatus Spechtbacterales bacterium]